MIAGAEALAEETPLTAENAAEICFGKGALAKASNEVVERNKLLLNEQIINHTFVEKDPFERSCFPSYFSPQGDYYRWSGDTLLRGFWRAHDYALCMTYSQPMGKKQKLYTVAVRGSVEGFLQTTVDRVEGDVFHLSTGVVPGKYDGKTCAKIVDQPAASGGFDADSSGSEGAS